MKTLYSPGEVAEQLNIQSSTLRKYADVLEKEGYTFIKNERGHRKYRESDVIVFRKVINLKNDTDMTLENATKQIVSWHQGVEVLPLKRHEVERYEEPDFNATDNDSRSKRSYRKTKLLATGIKQTFSRARSAICATRIGIIKRYTIDTGFPESYSDEF